MALAAWAVGTAAWASDGRPLPRLPTIHATAPLIVRVTPSLEAYARAALAKPHLPASVTLGGVSLQVRRTSASQAEICSEAGCAVMDLRSRSITLEQG